MPHRWHDDSRQGTLDLYERLWDVDGVRWLGPPRKRAVQLDGLGGSHLSSLFGRRIRSKRIPTPVLGDVSAIGSVFLLMDTLVAGGAIHVQLSICHILGMRGRADIAPPVVGLAIILVIEAALRPLAVDVEPSKPVLSVTSVIQRDSAVAICV